MTIQANTTDLQCRGCDAILWGDFPNGYCSRCAEEIIANRWAVDSAPVERAALASARAASLNANRSLRIAPLLNPSLPGELAGAYGSPDNGPERTSALQWLLLAAALVLAGYVLFQLTAMFADFFAQ